jgi:hypothetical protein
MSLSRISLCGGLTIAVSTLILSACGGTASATAASADPGSKPAAGAAASKPAAAPSTSAAQPAPSGASISITSPANGSTVPPGALNVAYEVTGVTLVPAANATKLDDYHTHVLLDVDPSTYIGQFMPVPTGNPNIIHTGAKTVKFDNVAPGPHTVTVFLTTSNHISVKPPVSRSSKFTVQ